MNPITMSSFLFLLAASFLLTSTTVNAECSLCITGDEPGNPDYELPPVPDSPIPIANCADLAAALNTPFTAPDSPDCTSGQSQGTVCGCPIQEGACYMCGSPDMVLDPNMADVELPFLTSEFLTSSSTIVANITCLSMDSLMNTWLVTDEKCPTYSEQVMDLCGCMPAGSEGGSGEGGDAEIDAESDAGTDSAPSGSNSIMSSGKMQFAMLALFSVCAMGW